MAMVSLNQLATCSSTFILGGRWSAISALKTRPNSKITLESGKELAAGIDQGEVTSLG